MLSSELVFCLKLLDYKSIMTDYIYKKRVWKFDLNQSCNDKVC